MEEAVSDARANGNGGELLSLDDKGCATGLRHTSVKLDWIGCTGSAALDREAVLLELEELCASSGGVVKVQPTGCLGNCSNAPNALLSTGGAESIHPRLCTIQHSADLVERACGKAPHLDDEQMVARLTKARRLRVRMQARQESKWNVALAGFQEDLDATTTSGQRVELAAEYAELLVSAGFCDKALHAISFVGDEQLSLGDIPTLQVIIQQAAIFARIGHCDRVKSLQDRINPLRPDTPRERSVKRQLVLLR